MNTANFRSTGYVAPKDRYVPPVLFSPYTGEPRDARDIQSDPQGVLIVPPGALLLSAPFAAAPTLAAATPAAVAHDGAAEVAYPELPEPAYNRVGVDASTSGFPVAVVIRGISVFTADQMRAYVDADRAMRRAALAAVAPLADDQIRAVFLANGFTVKDGQSDLKPYVFAAARALLALASAQGDAAQPVAVQHHHHGFARGNETLRIINESLDKQLEEVMTERDVYHDWADKLADAIAQHCGVDIGEHSSDNSPWSEALDALAATPQPAPVAEHATTDGPAPALEDARDAARDVLAERQRQISAEGWTPEHDDDYEFGELARAGAAYAAQSPCAEDAELECEPPSWWPWSRTWWKPNSRRGMLVKAGALILAELERLDRAALQAGVKPDAAHGPMTEAPECGAAYWLACPDENDAYEHKWENYRCELSWLSEGRCFRTEADARAALQAGKGGE